MERAKEREKQKELRNDYAGPFDPAVGLESFSRQALAHLGREYLLNGHLQDRVGMPLVAKQLGGDAYAQLAIDEWMGASPCLRTIVHRPSTCRCRHPNRCYCGLRTLPFRPR